MSLKLGTNYQGQVIRSDSNTGNLIIEVREDDEVH